MITGAIGARGEPIRCERPNRRVLLSAPALRAVMQSWSEVIAHSDTNGHATRHPRGIIVR
jgi:hypothetical protein